jgi:hypothetical protein
MVLAKIAALENLDDPPAVEPKPGEDWIPELSKLKKTPTAERRARFKDLSSESTPAMIGSDGAATRKCWDCGPGIATRTAISAEIQAADSN